MNESRVEASEELHPHDWTGQPDRPTVTFMGNTYDLMSLGALASGALMLFMCGTCNMGMYCLPLFPLALGAIGLLTASQSFNEKRTRQWSWIGLGIGAVVLVLIVAGFVIYIAAFVLLAAAGGLERGY